MSRVAPTDLPPPAYSAIRFVRIRSSLRPTILIATFFGTIWSLAAGVSLLKDRNDANNASSVNVMDLVMAIMWLFAAAVEIYGFGAAYSQRITLVRSYFYAATVAACVVTVANLLRLITHFTSKSAIIATCVADELADNTGVLSNAEAQSLCSSAWSNSTWWDVALLIITALVAFFFASLAASYLHQLVNPSTLRQQTATLAPSSAYSYPLAPYSGPAGSNQFVPPPYAPPPGPPPPPGYNPQWEGDAKEKDPFADASTPTTGGFTPGVGTGFGAREHDDESTDTVTLEPRREHEGRV